MTTRTKKPKPVAVLIADVHYNANTLALADAAMRQAITKANELKVPFIVAGDLHDTKANLRGECVAAIIQTFKTCLVPSYVIVGNHCKLNEKSEAHALEFLRPYVNFVVDRPINPYDGMYMLPYYSSTEALQAELRDIPPGSAIIMHQGVQTAFMGHYIQDTTSLPPDAFAKFRVVSGHYHRMQDIQCGEPKPGLVGTFSYIGNPYSLTFGEANDGPKGYRILMDDGSLEFVPTKLRRHVIVESETEDLEELLGDTKFDPADLIWVKLTGPKSELDALGRKGVAALLSHNNFKLDLIPTDSTVLEPVAKPLQDTEILDKLIDNMPDPTERKSYLKQLWRDLLQ